VGTGAIASVGTGSGIKSLPGSTRQDIQGYQSGLKDNRRLL